MSWFGADELICAVTQMSAQSYQFLKKGNSLPTH
jgi:hypothetical protein